MYCLASSQNLCGGLGVLHDRGSHRVRHLCSICWEWHHASTALAHDPASAGQSDTAAVVAGTKSAKQGTRSVTAVALGRNAADTNENQQEKDNRGKDDDESLSKKLDENEGVIEPPRDGDSEIVEPAPDTDAKIKVIPPPGEPGGDPNIQPK